MHPQYSPVLGLAAVFKFVVDGLKVIPSEMYSAAFKSLQGRNRYGCTIRHFLVLVISVGPQISHLSCL